MSNYTTTNHEHPFLKDVQEVIAKNNMYTFDDNQKLSVALISDKGALETIVRFEVKDNTDNFIFLSYFVISNTSMKNSKDFLTDAIDKFIQYQVKDAFISYALTYFFKLNIEQRKLNNPYTLVRPK